MLDAGRRPRADFDAIFDQISAIGAKLGEGVTRLAASAEDGMARGVFAAWMEQAAVHIAYDAIGNQFACFDWVGQDAPWILAGSHLDTQPRGGRFDGTLGVLSAGPTSGLRKTSSRRHVSIHRTGSRGRRQSQGG